MKQERVGFGAALQHSQCFQHQDSAGPTCLQDAQDAVSSYLSGFVELLLQSRHRHDEDEAGVVAVVVVFTAALGWRRKNKIQNPKRPDAADLKKRKISVQFDLVPIPQPGLKPLVSTLVFLRRDLLRERGWVKPGSGYWMVDPRGHDGTRATSLLQLNLHSMPGERTTAEFYQAD